MQSATSLSFLDCKLLQMYVLPIKLYFTLIILITTSSNIKIHLPLLSQDRLERALIEHLSSTPYKTKQ